VAALLQSHIQCWKQAPAHTHIPGAIIRGGRGKKGVGYTLVSEVCVYWIQEKRGPKPAEGSKIRRSMKINDLL
jgi:hypothetical protein